MSSAHIDLQYNPFEQCIDYPAVCFLILRNLSYGFNKDPFYQ